MILRIALFFALSVLGAVTAPAEQVVVDFEKAPTVLPDGKAVRLPMWEEKGVIFTLAREPEKSKAKGLIMFFTHLSDGHKGIVCAMATEPIPVRATFPRPVSSVTLAMWGSTAVPVVLEAFDSDGKAVGRKSVDSVPVRKAPGEPVPIFTMTVSAKRIAYIEFSGPREGEYLAADEVRFTPVDENGGK